MTLAACLDLAILGAGSAGLSLAAALAASPASRDWKVALIEARAGPPPERSFAFWATPAELERLPWPLLGQWSSWRFADRAGRERVRDGGGARCYVAVSALTHRRHCLEQIARRPGFVLIEGTPVHALLSDPQVVTIEGESLRVRARRVVDARNHADRDPFQARLYQQFLGQILRLREPVGAPQRADLMTDMSADAHGFRFVYRLPLAADRVLIEETRFTPRILPWQRLEADGQTASAALPGKIDAVLSTERGIIPMGLSAAPPPSDPRIRLAGTRGGAVRAATGYAFRRIQDWAERNVRQVERGGLNALTGHPPEPRWRAAMDRLFLEVLRRHPHRAPELFMALAEGLTGVQLADFLSDRGGLPTAARVVRAMPTGLFLSVALRRGRP